MCEPFGRVVVKFYLGYLETSLYFFKFGHGENEIENVRKKNSDSRI